MQVSGFLPRVWFRRQDSEAGIFTRTQVILMWAWWHSSHFYLLELNLISRASPTSFSVPRKLCVTSCLLSCVMWILMNAKTFPSPPSRPSPAPCQSTGISVKPCVSSWIQIPKYLESNFVYFVMRRQSPSISELLSTPGTSNNHLSNLDREGGGNLVCITLTLAIRLCKVNSLSFVYSVLS